MTRILSLNGKLPSALLALALCVWAAGARDLAHTPPHPASMLVRPHSGRVLQQASTITASYEASSAAELNLLAARQDTDEAEIHLSPERAYVPEPFRFGQGL